MKHDYLCPDCGKRIATYNTDAVSKGVFCWCKQCREEKEIKISIPWGNSELIEINPSDIGPEKDPLAYTLAKCVDCKVIDDGYAKFIRFKH